MSDVYVPFGDNQSETAVLLLAAAEEQGLEPGVVQYSPYENGFKVPEEVAKAAKADTVDPDADAVAEVKEALKAVEAGEPLPSQTVTNEPDDSAITEATDKVDQPDEKPVAKKAAAPRKTAAKKTAAKKTVAKKVN